MIQETQTAGRSDARIDLDPCLFQVDASKAWFDRRVLPLSIEQLRWRPGLRHWSIAECLDHLNLMLDLYLPKIDDAIARGARQGSRRAGCSLYDPAELAALELLEPPVRIPACAPCALMPAPAVDPDWLVDHFRQTRDRYADAVRRAYGLDLPRVRIKDPLTPPIASLGGVLALIAAHDRRHMWQAERVRCALRFPRAVFSASNAGKAGAR